MKHGKKYNDSRKAVDSAKQYASEEALSLVCTNAKAKFDETIEAHIRLGVDSRHADQQVRGAVVLPNGTGKKVRVLVFAKGDKVKAAEDAGAEYVGGCVNWIYFRRKAELGSFDLFSDIDSRIAHLARIGKSLWLICLANLTFHNV